MTYFSSFHPFSFLSFFSLNIYQEPGTLVGAFLKAVERNGAFQARSITLSLFFSLWPQGAR